MKLAFGLFINHRQAGMQKCKEFTLFISTESGGSVSNTIAVNDGGAAHEDQFKSNSNDPALPLSTGLR